MDTLISRYPPGYIEILGSVSVQLIYIAFGLVVERFRPAYKSSTTPKMLIQSLRNHIVATLMHVAYVFLRGGRSVLTRTFTPPYSLPTPGELLIDLVLALTMRDAVFWAIHRLWHAPGIYRFVHAKHHEVRRPGDHHILTISYMTVTDFVFLYGLPVVGVAKVLEMNILTTLIYSFVSAAGEQVKLVWGDEAHDKHHLSGKGNYGVYGVMDWVFGTAK
ncbi:fatty acid hydroxylase superfamily protein [Immersiella caudata]|uniref:Fatty acid hydroxylase superfamily protein n=1 Tax=Immersiella caudata TaxID=314043 RepID=A0AA40C5I6_9PEZI|nr:fatty acid hydroxylase superfamily protein [Immersiella caudata]